MASPVEASFRRFLVATAAVTYVAAAVELWLVEHFADLMQLVPFGLIGVGLGALVWWMAVPSRTSLLVLRAASALVALGAVVGVGLHVRGNVEFALEIHPDALFRDLAWEGASGASPLLAPGMLALAALLAAAATYRHSALS